MKVLKHILHYLALALPVLLLGTIVAIQLPSVQTAIARKALTALDGKFDAEIRFSKLWIKPFNTLLVKDLLLRDLAPAHPGQTDTLFHADAIYIQFSLKGLTGGLREGIYLKNATIKNAGLNLIREDNDYYRNNMRRIFHVPPTVAKPGPDRDIVGIACVKVRNFRFRSINFAEPSKGGPAGSADWKKLDMGHADLDATDFLLHGGVFSFDAKKLSFIESSGWKVNYLSMKARIGEGLCRMYDIHLEDDFGSVADFDYQMTGRKPQYCHFADSVRLEVNFRDSRWNIETLSHLVPALNGSRGLFLKVQGAVGGFVSDWNTDGLLLDLEDKGFATTLCGGVRNMNRFKQMSLNLSLSGTKISIDDLPSLLKAVNPSLKLNIGNIGKGQRYVADISAKGHIDKMGLSLRLKQGSDGGSLDMDVLAQNLLSKDIKPSFSGKLSTSRLDLRRLLGSGKIGPLSIKTDFFVKMKDKGGAGHGGIASFLPLDANLSRLYIDCLSFNDYEYSGIKGEVNLENGDIHAGLLSSDKSLEASLDIATDSDACHANAHIGKIDLYATNFDKRGPAIAKADVKLACNCNFSVLKGSAEISNLMISTQNNSFIIPKINLLADNSEGRKHFVLSSGAADAGFSSDGKNLSLNFSGKDMQPLLSYVLPDSYLENGSLLEVSVDSLGVISGKASSRRLAFKGNYLKDITLDISGTRDSICANLNGSKLEALGIAMASAGLDVTLTEKEAGLNFHFDNGEDEGLKYGILKAALTLEKRKPTAVKILPSEMMIDGRKWEICESSISIGQGQLSVNGFRAHCSSQMPGEKESSLSINGSFPNSGNSPLRFSANDIYLDFLNQLIRKGGLSFGGNISGEGTISSGSDGKLSAVDIALETDSLKFCGSRLGEIQAAVNFGNDTDGAKLTLVNNIDGRNTLNVKASYNPTLKTADAVLDMDHFPLSTMKIPLAKIFKDVDGSISGKISANGPLKDLNIESDSLRLDNSLLQLGFTGVKYFLDGEVGIDDNGVNLNGLRGHDRFNNPFSVKGGLSWKRMKDMAFDLQFNFDELEAANISPSEASVFYGQLFAGGDVSLTGPVKEMCMAINCKTLPGSDIFVVSNGTASASKSELLEFVTPFKKEIDLYEAMMASKQKNQSARKGNKMTMMINIDVAPTLTIGMDMTLGGMKYAMNASGTGPVEMVIKPSEKYFNILGDYTIRDGSFGVNVSDLIRRDLSISGGSSIKFAGKPGDSVLNLEAKYVTKASIATLIADTSSVSNRRIVECIIGIKSTLSKPELSFGINIPDLEPSVKSRVESALSSEDKVQKQVLALLLSNNFVPDEQSGIVNANSLIYSNVSDIMANQINQIFNRLNIPLDLGLNYQPGTNGATNIFDVAISTQLFNNRVIIGGTLGNKQNTASSTQSFFGDVDVQIKLDRRGEFRLNIFSHSADQYTNSLDNSQRNGLGFTWQNEFDHLGRFLHNLCLPKAKKEEAAAKEALEAKKTRILILDE